MGVLKHHSHATPLDAPGKDTYRLAQAGADVVIGVSAVQVAVYRLEDGSSDLGAVIARDAVGLDLLLTEGYKRGSYPKIEVHRAERSAELLCQPDELLALVSDTVYYSDLIVPAGSEAHTMADLRGHVFAFTDPISSSGRVYPTYLLQQLGETP